MAAVDPYSPCPCGSGQKFKWCCHKVEAHAVRAQRLIENGQAAAALEALEEGLRKEPGNPWLLTRKALYLIRQEKPELAKAALRLVLQKRPRHFGAQILMTRLVLETEGAEAGAAEFQRMLSTFPPEERPGLASMARVVGVFLSEAGRFPAALKHLKLAKRLLPDNASSVVSALRMIETSTLIAPWQKNPDQLSPPPEGLSEPAQEQFARALQWAEEGLWSSAASAFELLSAGPDAPSAADRNLGLCRLWLADAAGAVAALRRSIAKTGATAEAVDLEALCQQVAPDNPDDLIERVQLVWPLRDRPALLDALRADKTVFDEGPGPLNPDDEDSPEADQFGLLDRPSIAFRPDVRAEELALFVGRVIVGAETVALETHDDGRLDSLVDRFTRLAGLAIPRAHPRTIVLDRTTKSALALSWNWLVPEGIDRETLLRLNRDQESILIRDVWPETPMPDLGGRTPLQAAQAGDAEVPLRAAVWQLELTTENQLGHVDFAALRARLRVPAEPTPDPETVEIGSLHLARLTLLPVDRLNDERLAELYRLARSVGLLDVVEGAARELVNRAGIWQKGVLNPLSVFSDLATITAGRAQTTEALEWIRRGRQADPADHRVQNAPSWDMLELRIKTRAEAPQVWVPELAMILERYSGISSATQTIMVAMLDMGLVEMGPNPDRPGEVLVDTRSLQALLAEYGPRVTTASGQLGVSATKGGIWTPGAQTGGGGGLWTPGAEAATPAEPGGKSKLIITGR